MARRRCCSRRRPRDRRYCCSTPSVTSSAAAGLCFQAGLHICDDRHTSNQAVTEYCPRGQAERANMAEISESAVRGALEAVVDPLSGRNVVALGMVSGIATRGGHVAVTLEVDPARGAALEPLRQACEQAVRAVPGVLSATTVMTAERAAPPTSPNRAAPQRPQAPGGHAAHAAPGGGRIEVPG